MVDRWPHHGVASDPPSLPTPPASTDKVPAPSPQLATSVTHVSSGTAEDAVTSFRNGTPSRSPSTTATPEPEP